MRTAYFDCFSGISGNMVIGAMLDAGLEFEILKERLKKLGMNGYELEVEKIKKETIAGTYFKVVLRGGRDDHHRDLRDINRIIDGSTLNREVRDLSKKIFLRLAEAEARAHDISPEEVQFHEVGAVDSIIDIVGSAIGIYQLGIREIVSSPIPLGRGFINSQHGKMPNPSPGAMYCLEGVETYGVDTDWEIVTPTGAAIISVISKHFGAAPHMKIEKVGYGAGKYDLDQPNLLRIMIGETLTVGKLSEKIEANIDDMNPEMYENIFEKLFSAGAVDVCTTHVQMKKNRPAVMLSVICYPEITHRLMEIIYKETTSTGLRVYTGVKYSLDKKMETVKTAYGDIRLKFAYLDGKVVNVKPEHSDCRKIADRAGIPLKEIYNEVLPIIGKMQGSKREDHS